MNGDIQIPALGLRAFGDKLILDRDCLSANLLFLKDWDASPAPALSSSMTEEELLGAQTSGEPKVFTRTIDGEKVYLFISGAETRRDFGICGHVRFWGDLRIVCEEFESLYDKHHD